MADKLLSKLRMDVEREELLGLRAATPIKFRDFTAQYLRHAKGRKAPSTVGMEELRLKGKFEPAFGDQYLHKIDRAQVERFLARRADKDGVSRSTRNRDLSLLSSVFKLAVTLGHALENPAKGFGRPQEPLHEVPFLEVEDQERLLGCCADSIRSFATIALDTGARQGELLRAVWRDFDLKRNRFSIRRSKNGSPRTIPLTPRAVAALRDEGRRGGKVVKMDALVWPNLGNEARIDGERKASALFTKEWKAAKSKASLQLRFHDLRHTFAVNAVRAQVNLMDVRDLLGHRSLTMVLRYAHHVPKNAKDLAIEKIALYTESGGENGSDLRSGGGAFGGAPRD